MADFGLTDDGAGYDVDFSVRANGKRDLHIVRGRLATAQRLQMRYRTFLGESRYNRLAGVPWTQVVFVKGVTENAIRAVLEQVAINTPGVRRLVELTLAHDFVNRVTTGTCEVLTEDSEQTISVPLNILFR